MTRADELIATLELAPHPEGGWYRRLYRSDTYVSAAHGPRPACTSIVYLLKAGEISRWHRVDADETWHYAEGAPLTLWCADAGFDQVTALDIGPAAAQRWPQHSVAAHRWQAARSTGEYTLVGCTVAPGFEFAGFELLAQRPELAATLHAARPDLAALI